MKFQDRIPIEKREAIINALQTDPDLARRVAQMILLEDYFGIDEGYHVVICTN